MKIFREKPKTISKETVWVCIHNEYLYTHINLFKLIWIVITEWKSDKHLVG